METQLYIRMLNGFQTNNTCVKVLLGEKCSQML